MENIGWTFRSSLVLDTGHVASPTELPGHTEYQKPTPSAQWNQSKRSANELVIFIHSGFGALLKDSVVRMARTLACDLLASSQPP